MAAMKRQAEAQGKVYGWNDISPEHISPERARLASKDARLEKIWQVIDALIDERIDSLDEDNRAVLQARIERLTGYYDVVEAEQDECACDDQRGIRCTHCEMQAIIDPQEMPY